MRATGENVICCGDKKPFDHPKIFIFVETGSKKICPYCGKIL